MRMRLCAMALLAAATSAHADWNTQAGGNSLRNGRSPGLGPSRPTLLWQGSLPSGLGWSMAAAGDVVVFTRNTTFDPETGWQLVAHRVSTGAQLWTAQLPWAPLDPGWYTHVTGIRDGNVYATRAGGCHRFDYYYALDPADGSIRWRSQDKVRECPPESPAYAYDGDLIIGDFEWITRIDRVTGATVWRRARACPTTNGCAVAVFGDRGYIWQPDVQGPKVTAIDLATGQLLHSSPGVGGGFVQQLGPMVGPDGTVYAPRSQNNPTTDFLVAFRDTGTSFVERWRVPIGFVPGATFAVGRDGSVYSYTRDARVARHDPASGAVLGTSAVIPGDSLFGYQMAVDRTGTLYLADGENTLFSFDPDLQTRWSVPVPSLSLSPVALTTSGVLLVGGGGTDVRAYRAHRLPVSLSVDATPNSSDGNGVFEPGERVFVAPSWRNQEAVAASFTGAATGFTGPAGGTYDLLDATANYGTVPAGATANCSTATGDCYELRVTAPSRPALHWDGLLAEVLSDAQDARWRVHLGDSFADVPRASPFYRFVETVLHHSVTGGCTASAYCPAGSTARDQMAVFVLAAVEGPLYVPRPCIAGSELFSDVPAASPFCRWIEELARRGVVGGCVSGAYCPAGSVSREQMAVFALRAKEGFGYLPPACVGGQEAFSDVPAASPFCRWVEELARRAVVTGCGGGLYCPQQPVTREQMSVFLSRTFGLELYGP